MMGFDIPFVKGHMGGNEIILTSRADITGENELASGLKLLSSPHIGGDQLGLLYDSGAGNKVGVKIVDINSGDYLPACGGLTQVFGLAYAELDLGATFDLGLSPDLDRVELEMDAGEFPVILDRNDPNGDVITVMDSFLDFIYEEGLEVGELSGVRSYRVGHFLVTFAEDMRAEYPEATFRPIDESTAELLISLQQEFPVVFDADGVNSDFALIDRSGVVEKDGELIFPHNLSEGLVEQSCGSGTVAAAVAMVEAEMISGTGARKLDFASGGREDTIGGPETTEVELALVDRGIKEIGFSHSLVEVLARGTLRLPQS